MIDFDSGVKLSALSLSLSPSSLPLCLGLEKIYLQYQAFTQEWSINSMYYIALYYNIMHLHSATGTYVV